MKAEAAVLRQDSSSMLQISDRSAKLVITGPPYFDTDTEKLLREPVEKQRKIDEVESRIFAYACSLAPVFGEIARILDPDGYLVIQTKDIRYGNWLVPLVHKHETLAFEHGFRVVTRIYWDPDDRPRRSRRNFISNPRQNSFRAREMETFSILCRKAVRPGEALTDLTDVSWLEESVWRVSGEKQVPRHPHASPPEILRRLIRLYSKPGDLVVDPFCGGGGALEIARELGRDAIGFEIMEQRAQMARHRIEGAV